MNRLIALACALFLCGCATNWVKPGATQDDFAKDRYSCMQQSQQRVSGAYVNQYGGSATNTVITNNNLFNACMNSQGWTLQRQASSEQIAAQAATNDQAKAAVEAINREWLEVCAREELRPYYSKTPCKPEDTTLEQMADKSRISNAEKVALNKVRGELKRLVKEMEDVVRQYSPQLAPSIIARRQQAATGQDDLALDFYEGRITRGEYNKRRREIADKLTHDLQTPGQRT